MGASTADTIHPLDLDLVCFSLLSACDTFSLPTDHLAELRSCAIAAIVRLWSSRGGFSAVLPGKSLEGKSFSQKSSQALSFSVFHRDRVGLYAAPADHHRTYRFIFSRDRSGSGVILDNFIVRSTVRARGAS